MSPIILITVLACGPQNPHNINVQRDFDHLYNVQEKSMLIMVEHIKKKQIDKGLDVLDEYLKKEEPEIVAIGERLDSIILKPEEANALNDYFTKYSVLSSKYLDHIDQNLNPEQRDRFVELFVVGTAQRMVEQLTTPASSVDFFKKAIR